MDISELRNAFDYNPLTGVITWKVDHLGRKIGDEVTGSSVSYKNVVLFKSRLAFMLHHGSEPVGNLIYADGDKSNIKLSNLLSPNVIGKFDERETIQHVPELTVGDAIMATIQNSNRFRGKVRWHASKYGMKVVTRSDGFNTLVWRIK